LNERSRGLVVRGVVAVLTLLAAAKLGDEMARLVWRSGPTAAIDLTLRYAEVHAWFDRVPVYRTMPVPTYPPASYALLWPFVGWLSLEAARWFWAATTIVALAALTWLVVRESGATGAWQRALAALLLLAMNETGVVVGNGQLTLHVLAPLVAALLLIHRGSGTWAEDLAASVGVIFGMVKVTLAAPFLWLVLFAPRAGPARRIWPWRVRPALLVAAGYVAVTMVAAWFQDAGLPTQLREWLAVTGTVSAQGGDYANLGAWLAAAGLGRLTPAISVVVFVVVGVWAYRHRHVDLWVRIGVIALVTRFWAYHRLYDDVLVVLAFVALCRIATPAAVALVATSMTFMLVPARVGTAPTPWHQLFEVTHTVSWLGMLAFLGWCARNAKDNLEVSGQGIGNRPADSAKDIRPDARGPSTPGSTNHEMGTARMGRDPKTSVLNGWNQAWDVPNVFVTDGACMASSGNQNPSLTYMALTARASHYAVDAMKRGDL